MVVGALSEAEVRDVLPRTWHAFFARFGQLTPIQRSAARPIVTGGDVLVGAPTASGKTEAIMAPIVERILAAGTRARIAALVISPTRALANDLLRRLRPPLHRARLDVDIKTGDSSSLRVGDRPLVVITTPESLDSMMCRRTQDLRGVTAIVLDELHLLHGTARGDQLRCLLARLDRVADAPQRCGASATVPKPNDLLDTYFRPGAIWCSQPSDRPIVARLERASTLQDAADQIQRVHDEPSHGGRKLLVFANSRAQVEALAGVLRQRPGLDGKVSAHHGSLARGERLRVEGHFKDAPSGMCVATMTLEIGIDVGNVDRVVLLAPPPDVSALVQRVGRANRRQKTTYVLGLYQNEFERSRLEHLLECAAAGRMFDSPVAFRPDVIAQQLLGLLLQNPRGWVSAAAGHARLPPDVGRVWTQQDCAQLLDALTKGGLIRPAAGGRFVADKGALDLFERGHIHSLITDNGEREIVDRTTGRTVGSARFSAKDGHQLAEGNDVTLALGGTRRQVSHVRDGKVFVQSAAGSAAGRFISREAPRYSMDLARDLARHLGLDPTNLSVSAAPEGYRLSHFMGTVEGKLLAWTLEATTGFPALGRIGPFFMTLKELPHRWCRGRVPLFSCGANEILQRMERVVRNRSKPLARLLGAGPMVGHVPDAMVCRWLHASIDLPGLAHRAADFHVEPCLPGVHGDATAK